jgi:pSer/pThr/pTyr-binding forkhead associated (FHA) protein
MRRCSDHMTAETTAAFRADDLAARHTPSPPSAEGAVSGFEALPRSSALLVIKRGPDAGSRFELNGPTTSAGRHPCSDIFLDDITVSRHHAEFRIESGQFRIVDAGSLNGTYVNRQPVDFAVLARLPLFSRSQACAKLIAIATNVNVSSQNHAGKPASG